MSRLFIELYLDEDVDVLLAQLMRARGFVALTTQEAGQLGNNDAEQLADAVNQHKTLLTHHRIDFEALARTYYETSQPHEGIIVKDYSYLLDGTVMQPAASRALEALRVFPLLSPFDPVLAGTIPLDIDIPGSDLDVVCEATDVDVFAEYLCDRFGPCTGFRVRQKVMHGLPTVIAQFAAQGFPVEIFGQPLPVMAQAAVRHMVVEERLLRYGGPEVRHKIRQLKGQGLKTEPAFAAVFGLPGDPYQTLLALAELSEDVLISVLTPTLRTHPSGEMSF